MILKHISSIGFDDLKNLIDNEIRESRTIEYKIQLPNEGDSGKIPFLAEVCSFANTDGGDIIFGIKEEKGIPVNLVGLDIKDPDKEILSIENSILNCLDPRISSFSTKVINSVNKIFIILRIGKSWNAPHMVTYKDHSKFYKRNSAGKYPMDASELRMAFIYSEQLINKIRDFVNKRIQKIKNEDELPINLYHGAKLVLHLIPLSSFAELKYYPITQKTKLVSNLFPLGSNGCNNRFNLDGFLTYSGRGKDCNGYTQLFRNGIIEAVSNFSDPKDERFIPSVGYEENIIKGIKSFLEAYRILDITPPFYFNISFLGIKEYSFAVASRYASSHSYEIDRDDLILPEGVIDNFDVDLCETFRDFFDMIWNAFGYERSFNYDVNGKWVGQR